MLILRDERVEDTSNRGCARIGYHYVYDVYVVYVTSMLNRSYTTISVKQAASLARPLRLYHRRLTLYDMYKILNPTELEKTYNS